MRLAPEHVSRYQRGVGLVEILVAVLILGIGVLGFAGMQMKALKSTDSAFFRVQATVLASDIAARMALNPDQADSYTSGWNQSATYPSTCRTKACSASELATWDVQQSAWQAANLLPNGSAGVTKNGSLYRVVVAWNKTAATDCRAATDDCVTMEVMP